MKKKNFIFSIVTLVLFAIVITCFNYFKNTKNYVEDNTSKPTKITKGISMNLEQTAGAGDYKTVTQSGWPTEGYVFNEELSKCENGSEISWDDTKKAVIMQGNVSDKCYVYFDKVLTLANYVISKYTGTQGENSIYYHDSSLTNGAGDNSYRYAGGDYYLSEKAISEGIDCLYSNRSDDCEKPLIASNLDDADNLIWLCEYDTSEIEYSSYLMALEKAIADGYVSSGNINNFVCFGTNENPCPTDNLYRIIGVFNENYHGISGKQLVKLIKYDYMTTDELGIDGSYSQTFKEFGIYEEYKGTYGNGERIGVYLWNSDTQTNTWSESNLNKINLNTNYINNIGITWVNKIATTTWKVGGVPVSINSSKPSIIYENEIINPDPTNSTDNATEYSAKVGLMYTSDYGFAASPSVWTKPLWSITCIDKDVLSTNWMYMGLDEWTISRRADNYGAVYVVNCTCMVRVKTKPNSDGIGVRVVFNLDPSVTYVNGDGTQSSPIRIN